jgi:malate dehydrogenase
MIGQGRMFGPSQPVNITLLELPVMEKVMQGVIMELNDSALPLVKNLRGTTEYKTAFTDCEVAILVGAKPRGPGMERKDLLGQNAKIFKDTGKALNEFANSDCKVLVVGNPANTNAYIVSQFAPRIPKKNISALTRLDQNRAVYQVSNKLKVPVEQIKNIIIWGNHSATQFPDVSNSKILNYPTLGKITSIPDAIKNDEWIKGEFISTVQKRGAAIIEMRKVSSAASAANATCDHIYDWLVGTAPGDICSMAVISDGSYGVPEGICFSFPVTCNNGDYYIVQGLKWDEFAKKKIEITTKELLEEKEMAMATVKD